MEAGQPAWVSVWAQPGFGFVCIAEHLEACRRFIKKGPTQITRIMKPGLLLFKQTQIAGPGVPAEGLWQAGD